MKKETQKKAEPEVILSQHDPFVCRCGLGIDWGLVEDLLMEDVLMDCFSGVGCGGIGGNVQVSQSLQIIFPFQ